LQEKSLFCFDQKSVVLQKPCVLLWFHSFRAKTIVFCMQSEREAIRIKWTARLDHPTGAGQKHQPEAARTSQEQPEAARSSQKQH
jgi:hypothetical protein